MKATRVLIMLTLAALSAACGDDEPVTATGPDVPFSTEQFSAVLDPGGRRYYSFTLDTGGPVFVTLAAVVDADTGAPVTTPLRIGVGRPRGTECPPAAVVTTTAALVSQLSHLAPDGINCIDVADAGAATVPVRFSLRFTHP